MKTHREKHARLVALMEKRYAPPAWGLIWEVPDGTGARKHRTADALAMSLWPSRGLDLHGFELKTVRSDWLSELKKPEKAEAVAKFCDRWWVVTEPGVVVAGELPPSWGHIERRGSVLREQHEAEKTEAAAVDRAFLASIFRKIRAASDQHDSTHIKRNAIQDELAKEYTRGTEEALNSAARRVSNEMSELQRLRDLVKDFEEASGIKFRWRDGERVGKAMKMVLDAGGTHHAKQLERTAAQLVSISDKLNAVLKEWNS